MATPAKTRPSVLLDEYEGVVVFLLAEGSDPEALFKQICRQYDNTKIEQDREGNVYLMPPCGGESSNQNFKASLQLAAWAMRDGRGEGFDSSAAFIFPNGSKRVPDASWVSNERLLSLPYKERRKFLKIVPEFVIEIKSPTDRYSKLQEKMHEYIENGVELGWLIHPDLQEAKVYTQADVVTHNGVQKLRGTGPVQGFELDLKPIWEGLRYGRVSS
ncbi:MAG: Uma2 family endonuclease [Acidobacteriaceae bacterium]|nr:Uma2 family endonuclease [Acidobacteriaceae bacterium]